METRLAAAIGNLAASIDGALEARLPQLFALRVMERPAQVLVVVLRSGADIDGIRTQLNQALSGILAPETALDIGPISPDRPMLDDIRLANCRQARQSAAGLRSAGYPILDEVVLNRVLVSFGDAETTQRAIAEIQPDGTCWCGGTIWQGHTAMRISVSSWATTDEDVERSLETMVRIARTHTHRNLCKHWVAAFTRALPALGRRKVCQGHALGPSQM
jgi:hypothetical protein